MWKEWKFCSYLSSTGMSRMAYITLMKPLWCHKDDFFFFFSLEPSHLIASHPQGKDCLIQKRQCHQIHQDALGWSPTHPTGPSIAQVSTLLWGWHQEKQLWGWSECGNLFGLVYLYGSHPAVMAGIPDLPHLAGSRQKVPSSKASSEPKTLIQSLHSLFLGAVHWKKQAVKVWRGFPVPFPSCLKWEFMGFRDRGICDWSHKYWLQWCVGLAQMVKIN